MSLSARIREQLISSFRAELAEHVQTMNDGLLALEQNRVPTEQHGSLLEEILRAAHSLKGAARAIGVTAVEQLSHALEDVMAVLQDKDFTPTPEMFTSCYAALDAILAVQVAYESGETTPPTQALRALTDLETFRPSRKPMSGAAPAQQSGPMTKPVPSMERKGVPSVWTEDGTALLSVNTGMGSDEAPAASTPFVPAASLASGDETIRVAVSKLDALMAQLSELFATRIRAEERRGQLRRIQGFIGEWQRDWYAVRGLYSRMVRKQRDAGNDENPPPLDRDMLRLLGYLDINQDRLRELSALITDLSRDYDNDTMSTAFVVDALEEEIKRVRMLPLHTITPPFGRMVRDLSQSAGKEAVLQIVGAEVELDKRVLEQIKDPLVHLLRNAIDHGIELPEIREAAGKPRRGSVVLHAAQFGKEVVVTVSDDGAGLDVEAIRRTAVHRRASAAQHFDDHDLVDIIFDSGFSTSPIITDISGRGVGLDVVRRNVDTLGGSVSVEWKAGRGATFTLTLPLTLTSSRALMVRTSDQVFAVPLTAVERILYVSPEQIVPVGGHDSVHYEGRPVTVVRLSNVLDLPEVAREEDHISIIILTVGDRRMGYVVDQLAGEQEIVIKGLGNQLSRIGGIAGATIAGSGEVVLILHPGDLLKLALKGALRPVLQRSETQTGTAGRAAQRILIVDDSVTTRTLEKNILEAAGFEIRIATNGEEALNAIATYGVPDLIISDVSMPKLDGFGLTQRVKSDPRTANVPVILVTSLDSVEDKSRGIEVGADAYIVKGRFDQTNLLETIAQLI